MLLAVLGMDIHAPMAGPRGRKSESRTAAAGICPDVRGDWFQKMTDLFWPQAGAIILYLLGLIFVVPNV